MASSDEYRQLDGLAVAAGIREKQFSATEIVNCALQRAEALNPTLNAITCETYDAALHLASRIDSQTSPPSAPFAGVPFLIKDNGAVKGLPQTHHSRLFAGETAQHDAPIVSAFRNTGLVSLGKSNTPELCLTITTESVFAGPCRNPWNPAHSTGGSSGGSAAAVAAGIVPVAHATDGGGSIRIPAACCGLVGLKPSRGLIPAEPQQSANWSGMSVGHVVSRTVRDSAAMLDCIRLKSPQIFPLPLMPDSVLSGLDNLKQSPLKIAIQAQHPYGAEIHPDVVRVLEAAGKTLEHLGHEVCDQTPPVNYGELAIATGTIINVHVAQTVMPQLEKRRLDLETPLLEEGTRRMANRGASTSATDYVDALDHLRRVALQMADFFSNHDILVSPVLTQMPAPLGWLNMNSDDMKSYAKRFGAYSGFCSLFNATGQPSVSLPLGQSTSGLPIGILFSSRWGADGLLLQLARQLEQAMPWVDRVPDLQFN